MKLDSAITEALSLNPANCHVQSHGGSGFSTTAKITTSTNGKSKHFFLKTGRGKDAQVMFAGEHTSLNAIHDIVPTLCPASLAHGSLSDSPGSFLVTDFLDLSPTRSTSSTKASGSDSSSGLSLATKLATLHTTPAPPPPNCTTPQFGFPVHTACGSTIQSNTYTASWPTFFAQHRLLPILSLGEQRNGPDPTLRSLVERTVASVVPALLADAHLKSGNGGSGGGVTPVVVHGDLWSGNHGVARLDSPDPNNAPGPIEDVIFDPSACYAHSEYELGIMRLFGGFESRTFWDEYHAICPKAEPVEEFEDRVALYELYHRLNHYAIFGRGYRDGAVRVMEGLLGRYMGGGAR